MYSGTYFQGVKEICLSPPSLTPFRDFTYTPEITLTLLIFFRITFQQLHLHIHLLHVLSATLILSINSRVLEAKSRQKSANNSGNKKEPKFRAEKPQQEPRNGKIHHGSWGAEHRCTTGFSWQQELLVVSAVRRAQDRKKWQDQACEPNGICEENVVFRSGKWDKIQRILGQKSSEKCYNFPPFILPLVVLDIFPPENSAKKCSASWQWRWFHRQQLKRSKLIWEFLLQMELGHDRSTSCLGKVWMVSIGAPEKMGVFSRFVLFGVRKCTPLQTQTFGSGCPPVGWGSSTWRGGGRKVRHVPRNQGNQTFLAGYPGICQDFRSARKVWEKKIVFNFRSLKHQLQIGQNSEKSTKSQLKSAKRGLFISHSRWWERTPNTYTFNSFWITHVIYPPQGESESDVVRFVSWTCWCMLRSISGKIF